MKSKSCKTCSRNFVPTSRHLDCPACRSRKSRKFCACGATINKKSVLCVDCTSQSGESNGNWRGGKVKHKAGYVQVRIPDHPNAVNGYVFEHRLVMEDILGRYLLRNETVHHKNGIKDDNDPNNLELWVSAQPAGQRIEDLLAYAYSIIELYGSDFSPPTTFNSD